MESIEIVLEKKELSCPVCGQKRYITDQGNHEWTVHCSSPEARFWDFERGTMEQSLSRQHWDQSRLEMFYTPGDGIRQVGA